MIEQHCRDVLNVDEAEHMKANVKQTKHISTKGN